MNPITWLTNSAEVLKKSATVDAPTFSITKVYTILALVLTPLGTLLAAQLNDGIDFTTRQIVALTVAVLGFAAIALAADILGRAWVTAAAIRAKAEAEAAGRAQLRLTPHLEGVVPLERPVTVTVDSADGKDPDGYVLAARYENGALEYYVQVADAAPRWLKHDAVTFR